jgi:hypothetical protein
LIQWAELICDRLSIAVEAESRVEIMTDDEELQEDNAENNLNGKFSILGLGAPLHLRLNLIVSMLRSD